MSSTKKSKKKKTGMVILLIVLLVFDGYWLVHLILTNYDWIKPPSPSNELYMQLSYPPYENGVKQYYDNNYTFRGILCIVDLYVNYTGTLAVGVPINVYAAGVKYFDGVEITNIIVRFNGANFYTSQGQSILTGSALFNPKLYEQSELTNDRGNIVLTVAGIGLDGNWELNAFYLNRPYVPTIPQSNLYMLKKQANALGQIVYDGADDYYPSLSIKLKNGSILSAEYPYLNRRIQVVGADVVQTQEFNSKTSAMQFDGQMLSIFGVGTLGSGLGAYLINRKANDKNTNSQQHQSNSNNSKSYHKTHRKKSKRSKNKR